MRAGHCLTLFLLLCIIPVALSGCGHGSYSPAVVPAGSGQPVTAANPAPLLGELPDPTRLSSEADVVSDLFRFGSQFDFSLPRSNFRYGEEETILMDPDYGIDPDNLISIATYVFDLTGGDHGSVLHVDWNQANDHADAWIAFANYTDQRWDWFNLPASDTLSFDAARFAPLNMLVCVVAICGHDEWVLDHLWLGATKPPMIRTVNPTSGKTGAAMTFSCELHPDSGPVTDWAWDLSPAADPPSPTTASPTVTLQSPGVYHCGVTASNAVGTAEAEFFLIVTETWVNWTMLAVDAGYNMMVDTSLALEMDDGDLPHVACTSGDFVYHYRYTGLDWVVSYFDYSADTDLEITNTSLAIDSDGNGYLVYVKPDSYLKCFRFYDYGVGWITLATTDNPTMIRRFHAPRIALDGDGHPHVSFYTTDWGDDWDADFVQYLTNDGSGWSTPVDITWSGGLMDFGSIAPMVPLAIDGNGQPAVAYYDDDPGTLSLATRDGTWSTQPIESGNPVDVISLDYDSNGFPHVAYIVPGAPSRLIYATYNGAAWSNASVIGTAYAGGYISLKLDSLDRPHIAYYNTSTKDLHMTFYESGDWFNLHVDGLGDVGSCCSLAIDNEDVAHISYYDSDNETVKYAIEPMP